MRDANLSTLFKEASLTRYSLRKLSPSSGITEGRAATNTNIANKSAVIAQLVLESFCHDSTPPRIAITADSMPRDTINTYILCCRFASHSALHADILLTSFHERELTPTNATAKAATPTSSPTSSDNRLALFRSSLNSLRNDFSAGSMNLNLDTA